MKMIRPTIAKKTKKIILYIVLGITLCVISLVLFIHFNTGAAAQLTDNVLRPILGADTVVAIEKSYYNSADLFRKISSKNSHQSSPLLDNIDERDGRTVGSLDLKPINNTNQTPIKDEGVWKIKYLKTFPNDNVLAYTFVRPDKDRPYAFVTLIQIDMSKVRLGIVAGKTEPAGKVGKPGPGKVPDEILNNKSLVAAFDGGFQYRDGQYGMIVGETTYLPLKPDLGTLIGYTDGSLKIINYTNQLLGSNVAFVRQNCPILIENGSIGVTDEKNRKLWGRTITTAMYTWRSGIGLMKNGNLLYAVGNNLTPETLAIALKEAGATNAIQLDINPYWVRFNIFDTDGNGGYTSVPLTKDLQDGSKQYLNGYSKDFFYVYKR